MKLNIKEKCKNLFVKDAVMKFAVGIVAINIIYIIVGSILFSLTGKFFTYEMFAICLRVFLAINLIYIIFLFFKKKYKKNIVHLFMIFVIIFMIIATIFARNPEKALRGAWERFEGLFTILYYFSVMFLTSFIDKKYKKIIINFILIAGVVHAVYAIYQKIFLLNVANSASTRVMIVPANQVPKINIIWVNGFTINPNFLGSFMLVCLMYALGLFVDENKKIKQVIYFIYSILFTFALVINNTQSCIVGFILTFVILLVYLLKNRKFIRLTLILIMLISVLVITTNLNMSSVIKHFIKTSSEASQVVQGNTDDNFGSGRLEIWKKTLEVVPNHLLHGVGIDDYYHVFGDKPLTIKFGNKALLIDKAHNEYLQILVTEGIFCLISYLAMYGAIVLKGLKHGFKNKEIYLVLPIIGYLVQAFFNISVIEIAPIFYIAMGLEIYNKQKEEIQIKSEEQENKKTKDNQ